MSNPANRLPPEYDEMQPRDYDPEFTADISSKMRVPERLGVVNGHDSIGDNMAKHHLYHSDMQRNAAMNIPEKILLLGQDQSIGVRDLPNLHLDLGSLPPHTSLNNKPLGLSTPPRVITLDERSFPAPGDEDTRKHIHFDEPEQFWVQNDDKDLDTHLQNGYIQRTPVKHHDDSSHEQALLATPGAPLLIEDDEDDDEMAVMRRQINKLSRHIVRLEGENSKRSQREMVLYPVIISYLLFQVAKWLLTNK